MRLRRLVDLSMPIDARTPFYPGDPEPVVCPATTIAREGVNVSRLDIGSHTGTHCDAPYHFLEDGLRLDELPRTGCDVRATPETVLDHPFLDGAA